MPSPRGGGHAAKHLGGGRQVMCMDSTVAEHHSVSGCVQLPTADANLAPLIE
jgi:hypothetical protein